jgi:hypothetical protein
MESASSSEGRNKGKRKLHFPKRCRDLTLYGSPKLGKANFNIEVKILKP